MKTIAARITGKVQGVSYRAWTRGEAMARGLNGWVRNEADGSVRAVFSGSEDMVDEMADLLYEGPPAARVDGLEMQKAKPPEEIGFGILG
uniref:acylphosphatase n=1 Tax=Aquisalinus luteolus TaxID=1566827 RepID=A0A8J3A0Q4_9PROT|nr:acylphosphatase [Aquisalinus luteolus]